MPHKISKRTITDEKRLPHSPSLSRSGKPVQWFLRMTANKFQPARRRPVLYALFSRRRTFLYARTSPSPAQLTNRGEVQPGGGVNEKIEGFFDICGTIGLTGETWSLDPSPTCANHKFHSTPCAPSINGWRSLPESQPTGARIPKLQRDGQQTAEELALGLHEFSAVGDTRRRSQSQ